MLEEFARLYKLCYKKEFPWRERKIKSVAILFFQNISHTLPSCQAHVINLGTQVFIGTYSKSPHYSPHDPKAHEPDTSNRGERDEIGLIRTICVKVRLRVS